MNRYEKIISVPLEKLAKQIVEGNIIDAYCKSDCVERQLDDERFDCPHPVECCVRWLKEEVNDE